MNNHITLREIRERFHEQEMAYEMLSLGEGYSILVSEHGGRIFGPFAGEDGEGILWTNGIFRTRALFEEFLKTPGQWNMGGDRIWIAPEFPFFNRERKHFFETYTVQPGIDPGNYKIKRDAYGNISLKGTLEGSLYEHQYTEKSILTERTIRMNKDPLRRLKHYEEYLKGVTFLGYEQEVIMEDTSGENPMELEMWNLTQLNKGGKLLVPYTADYEFIDHYTPVTGEILKDCKGYAQIDVKGREDYKVSFKAAHTIGRAGYLNEMPDGQSYLLVRNYYNDPSAEYVSEPWDKPGERGASLHVYIDGGGQGGFMEFENSGKPFGGSAKREWSVDTVNYWYYIGEKEKLLPIAKLLLGIPG